MSPITFPTTYPLFESSHVAGPVKLWRAPNTGDGSEPLQANIKGMGELNNDGVEFDHKVTYGVREVQQLFFALGAYLTKQELDLKFTVNHLKMDRLSHFLGLPVDPDEELAPGVGTPGQHDFGLGEPTDILGTDAPQVEPDYGAWIFQFPSPDHNYSTTPKRKYAYVLLHKAAVIQHGSMKFGKGNEVSIQCTLKAFADLNAAGPNHIGRILTYTPPLP